MALVGVMENVWEKRWKSARYAVNRGWFEGGSGEVWRGVMEAVVVGGGRLMFDESEQEIGEWENVMVSSLALEGVCATQWREPWLCGVMGETKTSLLHTAAAVGSERVVEWVVERGGGVEVVDGNGATPLCVACEAGHLGVIRMLVEGGADVRAKNGGGENLLIVASHANRAEVVRYLLSLGVLDVNAGVYIQTPLTTACEEGHLEVVRALVEEGGADVDEEGMGWRSPVSRACFSGHHRVVAYMLEKGAWGRAPKDGGIWVHELVLAVYKKQVAVVQALVDAGVAVDAADRGGNTALVAACSGGSVDVVRVLLEGGAGLGVRDGLGRLAVEEAQEFGREEVLELLREWEQRFEEEEEDRSTQR